MSKLNACQIRLMGDKESVEAAIKALVATGLVAPTGEAPCRNSAAIRIYGVVMPKPEPEDDDCAFVEEVLAQPGKTTVSSILGFDGKPIVMTTRRMG